MKAVLAAVLVMALAVVCLVPAESADADYYDINGEKNVIGTGDDADFRIVYINHDYDEYQDMNMSVSYTASLKDSAGETVSNGVSPSSGDLDLGQAQTLTVSAPDEPGHCTLEVAYEVSVSYTVTDEEGNETEETEEFTRNDTYDINVVEPISLSVSLTNNGDMSLQSYGVYFMIDGEIVEDSYQTIDLAESGTTTVKYDWVTDAGNGQHTFALVAADGGNMADIEGLGVEHTFYIGDTSYTWMVVLLVLVIIIVLLVMVWVYRKPVKNYGKPKSRR